MSVHYKFKNNLDHDTVTFDGLSISVADLKKSIMHQKKIGKSSDFDLQITNAQTKEVYDNDEILVPKNTSVIVSRVPIQGGTKNKNSDKPDLPLPIDEDDFGLIRYDRIVKNADLVNANSTEEDKVKAMITQSSQEYDPSKYVKSRSMTGPLPPSYTCFRCGKQGHWIKNCPTNNPDVKRSTGIPRSFMVPVDGPEHKGALLTSSGDYAVPLIDHQAYKEVKKEKPPFVPQDEPVVEPEPQVPEELLCMVCNDLLQDAVLIPCCGNSFCDECVRQVLLESDNHECPICHETQVSPNTLIPNRFLRTAVANYKNEKGKVSSSLVRKAAPPPPPPAPQPASPVPRRVDSPQPSPDSTVESQSNATDTSAAQHDKSPKRTEPKKSETKDAPLAPLQKIKSGNSTPTVCHTPENATPKRSAETDSEDAQPGTPLADEPPIDVINPHHLPIQTIGHEHYSHHHDRYEHSGRYSRSRRDDYGRHYNRSSENQEQSAISTIETITNMRNKCKFSRPAPPRGQFLNQRSHRDDRLDYDHEEYHGRYEKKHERSSRRNHYDRSDRESRYTSSSHEYQSSEHEHSDSHYDVHQHEESSSRRHVERYRSPPRALLVTPSVPPSAIYTAPVPAVPPIHPPIILPPPQVFAPQPPPPGASPINTAQIPSQPPPPGVGPPLLPLSSEAPPAFGSRPFDKEAPLKDSQKAERSIDDRMEEFQRKLEKRDRDEYSRDRSPRSRSRSSDRHRSRSSSWSRSGTRSSTRTSRSRSRTPFSSRSRTRSFSPSRSRSWSKKRSYSRSRSRTRTKSRSRSRSRNDSRARRRGGSRDSRQWSPRTRGRSHSFSPKSYRHSSRRNESYPLKHPYNPPQYPAVSSYQSQYGPPPPPIIPMTVMRPPAFPPHHMHTLHPPPIQPIHSRSMEPYPPVERSMKYPPSYGGQYPVYDVYSQKYQQPKYDREQRFGVHRGGRYDRRSEYPRNEEEVHHRIPGWVGDRSRDYKPRYRQSRDIRGKEIRELPHIPEEDVKADVKESSVEASSKKKEEKVSSKHKKHHHHHKSKDSKKQDGKSSRASAEEASDSSKNLVKGEGGLEKEEKKVLSESDSKILDKAKDKKHKHKKHKTGDQPIKKKRSSKKEKLESVPAADGEAPPTKVKVKKKKLKAKTEESVKDVEEKVSTPVASLEEKVEDSLPAPEEVPEEETAADKPSQDSDVLDIFAEDPEPEAAGTKAETVQEAPVEENTEVANNVEMMEAEKIEETINSEEETEEIIEEENVLRVDVPGISKWEREESEDEESTVPQRRSSVVVSTEETGPISSDIISRAENVLLSKQFKPRIESRDDKNSRDSSEASSRDSTPVKRKEAVELKSVVNSEQLHSDTLQVIVSNKDKRAVYSRKEEGKSSKSEIQVPKRSRSDKSSYRYYEEPRRSLATYPSREERIRDYRDKGSDRRDLKYSPTRKGRMDERIPLREHKEYIRRPLERDVEMREDSLRREDRKRRFESARGGDQSSSHDRKKDHYESRRKQELQKYVDKGPKSESYKRFRAGSMDSSRDSFDSYGKRGEKRQPVEERHKHRNEKGQGDSQESARRKHSPIKAPGTAADHSKPLKREFHDELKFEPDYDEFSDIEEKIHDVKEKHKKRADSSPEIKRAKVEKPSRSEMKPHKPEKSNVSSSSSAVSESDSSDSDEPKGKSKSSDTDHKQKHKKSKHKKHKKHKHKHKKKKSHKSKRD